MKYVKFILFAVAGLLLFNAQDVLAQDSQDSQWLQYRQNSHNNPVIQNDELGHLDMTLETEDEVRSTPVVVEDRVFIGNHDSGMMYAYDLNTGEQLWANQAPNWVHSDMIYADGQLFVGYGNRFFQSNGIRGMGDSGLLRLDPDDGEIIWDFETDGEVMPTPVFYDDTVYITTGDRHLYGIEPETGEEEWTLNLGSVVSMSSPNLKDGILYVGGSTPYKTYAIDLDQQEKKWDTHFPKVTSGMDDVPPVISDEDIVYTTAVQDTEEPLSTREVYDQYETGAAYKQMLKRVLGDNMGGPPYMKSEHKLYAMDADNGDLEWATSLGKGAMIPNNKSGAPMLYDDKLFVGSPITESFYAYDANTGEKLWQYDSHINKAAPVADDGIVYFTDTQGLAYGFDTDSGQLQGKKHIGGALAPAGPIIVNDHLMIPSQDTNVHSIPTKDILQTDDEADDDNSFATFVLVIYVLPIVILLAVMAGIVWMIRYGLRQQASGDSQ